MVMMRSIGYFKQFSLVGFVVIPSSAAGLFLFISGRQCCPCEIGVCVRCQGDGLVPGGFGGSVMCS